MSKKAESRLQQRIKKALIKECGGKWWKVHGSAFQESGQPDLDGVVDGISFKFEVKVPLHGRPSALQLQTMHEWRKVGAIACLVETPSQAISLVRAATSSPEKRRKGRKLYKWICATLRSTHGEDMGYGRSTVRGVRTKSRRTPSWAKDQFIKYMGEVPFREAAPLLCVP